MSAKSLSSELKLTSQQQAVYNQISQEEKGVTKHQLSKVLGIHHIPIQGSLKFLLLTKLIVKRGKLPSIYFINKERPSIYLDEVENLDNLGKFTI